MGGSGTNLLLALLLAAAGLLHTGERVDHSRDLPDRLTDREFRELIADFSEPPAKFIADNLVSNELSFAQVVPALRTSAARGGAFLGVGPEQNFTFIAAIQPRIAFVLDIQQENLLLHLLYKALFEFASDRTTFVSLLFSRPRSVALTESSTVAEIMDNVAATPAEDETGFQRNVEAVRRFLLDDRRLPLSSDDLASLVKIYRAFQHYGPSIGYATTQVGRPVGPASYLNLMKQVDADGKALSYLGTEDSYRTVRDLHARNLVIPVVGNFAGPKALRAIGSFLRSNSTTVTAFYVSNVEDYLGRARVPQNGEWWVFCRNVSALPIDERSIFIRPFGVAAYDSQGALTLSKEIAIAALRGTRYPAGSSPAMPPALFPILQEIGLCSGQASRTFRPAA